ncbi:MAG TPA: ATP-binding protein [Opitutus sp.]|nr:ATP-binding protein [Opitutus sp.]
MQSHENDSIFDRLFNFSLDLICVAGFDGYFKRVNPSWSRVLGWSEAELLTRPIESFMHPDDRERTIRARDELKRGIPLVGLENRYLCKDGSHRWLSWQSVTEPGAPVVFAIARDVTERRHLDHERLVMGKLESTGILAGGIAHDFNNLLASLLLSTDMVRACGPVNAEQAQQLAQMRQTIESARILVKQLITFAEGDLSTRHVTNLAGLLAQSIEVALGGSELHRECRIPPELWQCDADETQLAQVFRGLIMNAREATVPRGHLRISAENVALAARNPAGLPPGDFVRIVIADDGVGIPADVVPRIFDPYFSTKPRGIQKGMGLGLTLCRMILQRHGGAIGIESFPGRGTSVICHLPAVRNVVDPSAPIVADHKPGLSRILVMDDEDVFREVLGRTLRQFGYEVELARDGEAAVALYERAATEGRPFGIVLLDLAVRGGMGGSKTLQALRARDPAVAAILMTGYSNEETFRDHARHGFTRALAKPFPAETLRSMLTEILGPLPRRR